MTALITVLHVFACVFLILVVLLQSGKGGGMGIAFGGGSSQTVFGSSGAGNFLTKATAVTAAIFMITSVSLAYFASQQESKRLQQMSEKRKQDEKTKKEHEELLRKQAEGQSGPPGAPGPAAPPLESLPSEAPAAPTEKGPGGPAPAKRLVPVRRPAEAPAGPQKPQP